MAELKVTLLGLLKLLAHSLVAALFVIIIAIVGTVTTFALGYIYGGSNHLMCYVIWLALEVPFLFGIAVVVTSQVLNQADEFFATLHQTVESIANSLRHLRKRLPERPGAQELRKN